MLVIEFSAPAVCRLLLSLPTCCSCLLLLNFCAGVLHFCNREFTVAWFEFNRAHRIFQRFNSKPLFQSIEHCVLNAVVSCQASDPDFFGAEPAKLQRQIGTVEGRIRILVAEPFRDYPNVHVINKVRMKLRAFCVLHTMHWPGAAISCEVPGFLRVPVAALEHGLASFEKFLD